MVKKIAKHLTDASTAEELRDTKSCVASAKRVLTLETTIPAVRFLAYHLLCRCYLNDPISTHAVSNCQEALKIRRDPDVLCDSAEANLAAEMYDDGKYRVL